MEATAMTRIAASNLRICIVQLLVTEALVIYPAVHQHAILVMLAPVSLLALAPAWALHDRAYGAFLVILFIDFVFLAIMILSIRKGYKLASVICLFAFNFIGMGFIAAGV